MDHKINDKLNLFGRYNYSPSELTQRGETALSRLTNDNDHSNRNAWGDLGESPIAANDFRFNYSSTDASTSYRLDSFGGAVPLATLPFPSPFTAKNGILPFM